MTISLIHGICEFSSSDGETVRIFSENLATPSGGYGRIGLDWSYYEDEYFETVIPCKSTDDGALPIADAWQKLRNDHREEMERIEAEDRAYMEEQAEERRLIQSWSDDHAQLEYLQDALEGVRLRGSDIVDQGSLRGRWCEYSWC
jgi:hypothetical protein